MSKGSLGQVVQRAIGDAAFRRQLQSDPEGALKGFDLTSDERAALRSGDASKLSTFGVDQRMSKAFALGEGASAVSRANAGSELSDSGAARAALVDLDAGGGSRRSALDDQHGGPRAAIGDNAAGGRAALENSGTASREGTAYITADEAGNTSSPSALASSDSSASTAFMTSDEMGTGIAAAQTSTGDAAGDALQPDTTGATWAENPEHQG